ncbi:TolC family protein [soil metagenome]
MSDPARRTEDSPDAPGAARCPMRGACFALLVTLAGLAGCRALGPFGELDSDLGRHASEERLRRIDQLNLDRFTARTPTPAASSLLSTGAGPPDKPNPGITAAAAKEQLAALRATYERSPSLEIDLAKARAETLRNNLDLRVALIDPSIARESVNAERAKFDAVFTPFVTHSSSDTASATGLANNRVDETRVGAGVSVPLRSGGRASVDFVESRLASDSPFSAVDESFTPGVTFSLSQPLLRGAGRDFTVASIAIAGYNEQIVESRTKLEVISQLARAERAYWNLYAARRELEVRQTQFELAATLLQRAEARRAGGVITGVEVTRAQSGVAQRLGAIITAETNLLIQQRELKRIMNTPGLEVGGSVLLTTVTQPTAADFDFDSRRTTLVALAATQRMELLESELQALADTVNINVQKNLALPALDFAGSVGLSGAGTRFADSQRGLFGGDSTSYTLSLQGQIPLTNDAAEARVRGAILTRIQRLATAATRRQLIEQEVLDAIDRARSAWQRILAARQNAILSGRTFEVEQRLFENGVRTATDVLDAAAVLADAQSAEIRALADYQIALSDLATATGTTLGQADVRWEEEPQPPIK